MKPIRTLLSLLCAVRAVESFANHATADAPAQDFLTFANQLAVDDHGWVQLSPFGDFPNVDSKGGKVVQRFEKADAEAIVNEFNSLAKLPQRLLGLPFYVGHPDHPRFKGQPGHSDSSAKGRIKQLEVREDGLYANVKFNSAGRQLLEDEAFHGHSVNWAAIPSGSENGARIFRPVSLKSVGFTNQPQIPVKPAALANEEEAEQVANAEIIPPKLKLIAGFKEDEDVTMEQIIAALEKARPLANEEAETLKAEKLKAETDLANIEARAGEAVAMLRTAESNFANERKARATLIVDGLVQVGKILLAEKNAKIEALANAGDDFEAKVAELANAKTVIKTEARTGNLGRQNVEMIADVRQRQARHEELMSKRAQQFPNETFDERFAAVAASPEGSQLFAQMTRAGSED